MSDSLRIDRWLFFCRFFKTRSKATAAVTGGHVKLNGERASPGIRVSVGDRIELGQIRAGMVVSCESAREIVEIVIGSHATLFWS